jgi:hypothetical protein
MLMFDPVSLIDTTPTDEELYESARAKGWCLYCCLVPAVTPDGEQCTSCHTCACGEPALLTGDLCEAHEIEDIEREARRMVREEHGWHPVEHRRAMVRAGRNER